MFADDTAAGSAPAPAAGAAATSVVIPDAVRAQFGELIELILKSESMNNEERQYWVNILPVMTPEQVQNLRDILENEKKQLAAIDQKYSKDMNSVDQKQFVAQVDEERKRRLAERAAAEQSAKQTEDKTAEDLLNQINAAG